MTDIEETTEELEVSEGWKPKDAILAVAAFAVIAAIVIGGFLVYQARKAPPLVEGNEAPDFTLPLLNGGEVKLSDYRGKVLLINIWATWCNPCREEMPSIQRLYQSTRGRPFDILAISIDTRGSTDVAPFVKSLGLTFPILLDADKDVNDLYQTTGVPESFIIDKEGVLRERIIGPLDWSDVSTHEYQLIQHLIGT
jgi:peroxiredoxin